MVISLFFGLKCLLVGTEYNLTRQGLCLLSLILWYFNIWLWLRHWAPQPNIQLVKTNRGYNELHEDIRRRYELRSVGDLGINPQLLSSSLMFNFDTDWKTTRKKMLRKHSLNNRFLNKKTQFHHIASHSIFVSQESV